MNTVAPPKSAHDDGVSSLNSASLLSRQTVDVSSKYTLIMLFKSVSGPESALATESSLALPSMGPVYESTLPTGEFVWMMGLSSK